MVGFLLHVPSTFIISKHNGMCKKGNHDTIEITEMGAVDSRHIALFSPGVHEESLNNWPLRAKCKTVLNTFCFSLYCNAVMYRIAQGHVVKLAPIFSARTKDKQTQIISSDEWRCSAHIAELLNDSCEADISVEGLLLDKTVAWMATKWSCGSWSTIRLHAI